MLIDDARDLVRFASAVQRLLGNPAEAAQLGANARARAADEFLGDRHFEQYGGSFADA